MEGRQQAESSRAGWQSTQQPTRAGAAGFVETLTLKVSGETMVHQGNFVRNVFLGYNSRTTSARGVARALGLSRTALVPKRA